LEKSQSKRFFEKMEKKSRKVHILKGIFMKYAS